ncbi:MAG TPA: hypothetical protein ACFE0H_04380, partial [Elainellaceae cyanobacterium]
IRFYECHGNNAIVDIPTLFQKTLLKQTSNHLGDVQWVNLLDAHTQAAQKFSDSSTLFIGPCAIASISMQLTPASSIEDTKNGRNG